MEPIRRKVDRRWEQIAVSKRFVVIYEAQADFTIATELADRVLIEQIDWLNDTPLESQRHWIGDEPSVGRLTWKSIPGRAEKLGLPPVRGHFEGEPGLPDAQAARRAILFVRQLIDDLDAIVLVRDADDQLERRKGLEQARSSDTSRCTIVIGLAIIERECWVISGFDPKGEDENERLSTEKRKLGWNPCLHSQNLTAGKKNLAKRSPKRVLAALTDSEWDRQRECWTTTPLDTLRERGQQNGLRDYLDEVRKYLVPLIAGREAQPEQPS